MEVIEGTLGATAGPSQSLLMHVSSFLCILASSFCYQVVFAIKLFLIQVPNSGSEMSCVADMKESTDIQDKI